jgi:hypothetical protein
MSPSIFSKKGLRVNLLPAITWKSNFFLAATLLLNGTFACLNATAFPTGQLEREMKKATQRSTNSFQRNYKKVQRQLNEVLGVGAAGGAVLGGYGLIQQNQNERNY